MCYYITWQLTLAEFRLGLEGDDGRASEWERDAWRFICIPFALVLTAFRRHPVTRGCVRPSRFKT
jgi:hypothetical protein